MRRLTSLCGDAQPWKAVDVLANAFDTKMLGKELLRGENIIAACP